MNRTRLGYAFGFGAYICWGLFPLYWQMVKGAKSLEIVSHRAVWSLFFCLLALGINKQLGTTFKVFKTPDLFFKLALASALISVNWLVYIWAVTQGRIVDASLGYYINPLVVIGYGTIFLHEKLRKLQWFSVVVATIGVIVLTIDASGLPWIGLSIALSWGSYGYVKKKLGLGSLESLAIETVISFIPYCGYIFWLGSKGHGQFGHGWAVTLLLIGGGVVTAVPLLLFNGAATRLPLSVVGLMQFITPTINFILGVWVKHESMTLGRWIGFLVIWVALIALGIDLVKSVSPSDDRFAQGD